MAKPQFITTIGHYLDDDSHWLTRRKLVITAITMIVTGLLLGLLETTKDSDPEIPVQQTIEIPLPARPEALRTTPLEINESERAIGALGPQQDSQPWKTVTVRSGQTLDGIFRNQGYPIPLLHEIMSLNEATGGLKKIRPGDVFEFRSNPAGEFDALRYELDDTSYLVVTMQDESPQANVVEREIITEVAEAEGQIKSSLFLAGKQAGLSDAMVMKLANIFGWDIDFILDIREGDRFMLVYEKLYREGEFLRDGEILAATFVNQGERFQAIRFNNGETADYYAPDGRNMRKAFLRAPLNFRYISSQFNPRRMHPVLKRIRPHNGIDYYAPRGTPVYAAGEGTVVRSAYSKANGHHVFIRHAGSIETRYLHFTNRAVKQGQKVRQGQTIGYVGSTGLATGPHLHYEFVVNGVHRNPRTVPLPKVEPLAEKQRVAFQAQAAPYLTRLSRMESASLYASRD